MYDIMNGNFQLVFTGRVFCGMPYWRQTITMNTDNYKWERCNLMLIKCWRLWKRWRDGCEKGNRTKWCEVEVEKVYLIIHQCLWSMFHAYYVKKLDTISKRKQLVSQSSLQFRNRLSCITNLLNFYVGQWIYRRDKAG